MDRTKENSVDGFWLRYGGFQCPFRFSNSLPSMLVFLRTCNTSSFLVFQLESSSLPPPISSGFLRELTNKLLYLSSRSIMESSSICFRIGIDLGLFDVFCLLSASQETLCYCAKRRSSSRGWWQRERDKTLNGGSAILRMIGLFTYLLMQMSWDAGHRTTRLVGLGATVLFTSSPSYCQFSLVFCLCFFLFLSFFLLPLPSLIGSSLEEGTS